MKPKERDTRVRLLETAIELIWRSSYDSVGVSDICRQAKAHKGSFYYFFHSKEELAIEALEEHWRSVKPLLDEIFDPGKPPVTRLLEYCEHSLRIQEEKKEQIGHVCGCPYTTLGLEQCSQSRAIRETAENLLNRIKGYFVQALQDAADAGEMPIKKPQSKADELFTLYLGAQTHARIRNDVEPMRALKEQFNELLNPAVRA